MKCGTDNSREHSYNVQYIKEVGMARSPNHTEVVLYHTYRRIFQMVIYHTYCSEATVSY